MARKIQREPIVIVEDSAPVAAKKEVLPLDVSFILKDRVSVTTIRKINGMIYFNDGYRMKQFPVIQGKPITVTMKQ